MAQTEDSRKKLDKKEFLNSFNSVHGHRLCNAGAVQNGITRLQECKFSDRSQFRTDIVCLIAELAGLRHLILNLQHSMQTQMMQRALCLSALIWLI